MNIFKRKPIKMEKSNVKRVHIEIKTTLDRTLPLSVSGYILKNRTPISAEQALWEKLNNQYIKISSNFYLNTDSIESVKIQATEDLLLEHEV